MGAVFRYVQQYAGASQAKIGAAVDLTQARVNEVINGRREVPRLEVYERIANGLGMPDDARHPLGLAASRDVRRGGPAFDLAAFPEVVGVYASQASAAEEIQRQARAAAELDVLAVGRPPGSPAPERPDRTEPSAQGTRCGPSQEKSAQRGERERSHEVGSDQTSYESAVQHL